MLYLKDLIDRAFVLIIIGNIIIRNVKNMVELSSELVG